MWEDVDPRIDFFCIYVSGLTNAFKIEDSPGAFKPGDPIGTGRTCRKKTLQLNFWRPGDSVFAHEREFRFGIPFNANPVVQKEILTHFGLEERLDYLWVNR
jgi:hypothetical protein